VKSVTLDEVIETSCHGDLVSIIKTDTDGFDAEVLLSGLSMIKKWTPVLYFECDTNEKTMQQYVDLYDQLEEIGYSIFAYDNFGMPFIKVESKELFIELLNYCQKTKLGMSNTTIYYFDCLAYHPSNELGQKINSGYEDFVVASIN
jgi:hypothetical protein